MRIFGLVTALITPFKDGAVDEEGLRTLIRRQVAAEVDGIVLLGTTGESPTLTAEERLRVIEVGVEECEGAMPLIIGTGSNSTAATLQETRIAQQLGADAALLIAPYYNRPGQDGLRAHFEAVANGADLPLILYNHPGRTGLNLSIDTVQRLAEIDTIIGIKEANSDITAFDRLLEMREGLDSEFFVMSGNDELTLPAMALGADGVISVVGNVCPSQMRELVRCCAQEQLPKARILHRRLRPVFEACVAEVNPIPVKAMVQLLKLPAGDCRLPLTNAKDETIDLLKSAIERSRQ